ncbi:MAG: T9SS type A sorting domain-containing protein [Ginsengibacter sp.]
MKISSGKFNTANLDTKNNIKKSFLGYRKKAILPFIIGLCIIQVSFPLHLFSQKLEFSYSYFNLTRNSGGGTLENGDTIEIHALVKVNSTTDNFYYIDTIPAGTQYVGGSMELMTNEGILFDGPYTNTSNDDEGVYVSTGAPRIRVNIGTGFSNARSGASFGSATGGGTVTAGTVPKFYGSTLFIVAYKLKITAANGDTLNPTGNFYFDTSGVNRKFRFNYAGIKVVQNQALCTNFSSSTFTAESSFGTGSVQNRTLAATVPGYTKINLGASAPGDNYYSIANNTSADGTTNNSGPYKPTTNNSRVFGGFWDIIGDHTGAANQLTGNLPALTGHAGGYMLVVNAAFTTGEVYRDTIKNVCPNTYYEFSAWVRNICGVCGIDKNSVATYAPGVYPNLSYTINDIDYYTTGNILHDTLWQKRGFIYKTGSTETQFRITIKNNAAGGGGNDWVLDDIKLATCYPNLINNPKDTATSCTAASLTLSDTVKSYFNNYTNFCWEKSTNGTTWTSTGVCGSKAPTLVNGLWTYVVDTTFVTVKADSGTYYRLKVGTTSANLSDPNCSVTNSQKIFLKVFNVSCTLLDSKLIDFRGNIESDKSVLRWTTQNEKNLKEYIVEKSLDGINFYRVAAFSAINDIDAASYIFNDPEKISAVSYYRLDLISRSAGDHKYSRIISLYNYDALFRVSVVNPFKTDLKLDIFIPHEGQADIFLYDALGNQVCKKSIQLKKGNTAVMMDDVSKLPAGLYILRTQFNNKIIQNKLFKIN